jgi:DNA repair exonuclease SbcCD ATPase subunit
MRTIIIFAVMAVVLFGLAAGASIFLTNYLDEKKKSPHNETAGAQDTGKEAKELPPIARGGDGGSGSRPGTTPETEQLVQELAKLRERQESLAHQEQQVARRRQALEIIKEDIKSVRDDVDMVRKDLTDQIKGAGDELAAAEKRVMELEQRKREEEELLKDAKRGIYETEAVRTNGVKRVSAIADTTEPTEVAAIFERMAESGTQGLMTAAQILASMKDRRAAAVLSAIQDKTLAADLLDRMVGMKQAAAPAGAKPLSGKPERVPAPTDSK